VHALRVFGEELEELETGRLRAVREGHVQAHSSAELPTNVPESCFGRGLGGLLGESTRGRGDSVAACSVAIRGDGVRAMRVVVPSATAGSWNAAGRSSSCSMTTCSRMGASLKSSAAAFGESSSTTKVGAAASRLSTSERTRSSAARAAACVSGSAAACSK
jgi:hypothetical protein